MEYLLEDKVAPEMGRHKDGNAQAYLNNTGDTVNGLKAKLEDITRQRERLASDLKPAEEASTHAQLLLDQVRKNNFSGFPNIAIVEKSRLMLPGKHRTDFIHGLEQIRGAKNAALNDIKSRLATFDKQIAAQSDLILKATDQATLDAEKQRIKDQLARDRQGELDYQRDKKLKAEADAKKALEDENESQKKAGAEAKNPLDPQAEMPEIDQPTKKNLIKGVPNKVLWVSGVSLTIFTGIVVYYKFLRKGK